MNQAPQTDAWYSHAAVLTQSTRGTPPKDARYTHLTVSGGPDRSLGNVARDASYTNLAVSGTIAGSGSVAHVPIGHV